MNGDFEILDAESLRQDPILIRIAKNILPVVIAITIALILRAYIVEPIKVSGSSMDSTYHDGQYVILEKVSYWFRTPQRGDVVVCHYPDQYYTNSGRKADSWCVKRVIGISGDTLQTIDGVVYLNGEPLDEPYLDDGTYTSGITDEVIVPEGHVFVMGDNRFVSADSREINVGPIPYSNVRGKLMW